MDIDLIFYPKYGLIYFYVKVSSFYITKFLELCDPFLYVCECIYVIVNDQQLLFFSTYKPYSYL